MNYYKGSNLYIESAQEYQKCGWLTVEQCEKNKQADNIISALQLPLFSMSYTDIINERYSYDKTAYADIKVNDVEYSMTGIALIADVLKSNTDYEFYQSGNILVVHSENGYGFINGLKRKVN